MRRTASMLLFVGLLGPWACRADDASTTPSPHSQWGYSGEQAPEHWAELDEDYQRCASGEMQSPINLPPQVIEDATHLEIRYQPAPLQLVDNGHTVQINHQGDSHLSIDGRLFRLLQYHLHSPSEHAEEGQRHPLELHLVHVDDAGNYAVIGVFLEPSSAEDPAHEPLWRHLPQNHDSTEHVYVGEVVDPTTFVPSERAHYRYEGSLTTPPCTETVTWLVMRQPLQVTNEHIEAFREIYRTNARPLQPRANWCLLPHPPE